jgi:hypothetical protein
MNRRGFLKSLLLAPLIPLLPFVPKEESKADMRFAILEDSGDEIFTIHADGKISSDVYDFGRIEK